MAQGSSTLMIDDGYRSWPSDTPLDGHHDLALLLVGFHVPVGVNNAFQRERAVDDGFQRTGFEPAINELFAAGKPLGVPYNLEQGVPSHRQALAQRGEQREGGWRRRQCAVFEDGRTRSGSVGKFSQQRSGNRDQRPC